MCLFQAHTVCEAYFCVCVCSKCTLYVMHICVYVLVPSTYCMRCICVCMCVFQVHMYVMHICMCVCILSTYCMHMHVCVYVCVCVCRRSSCWCAQAHTHTHIIWAKYAINIHACIHTYIHTYIHTQVEMMSSGIGGELNMPCVAGQSTQQTYIHIHACIHTYIHTYIHIYIHRWR